MPDQRPDSRVYFAVERTFLAWIRTGLALMAFGIVVARLGVLLRELEAVRYPSGRSGLSLWFGVSFVILGVITNIAAAVQYVRRIRKMNRGDLSAGTRPTFGVALAIALAVIGTATVVYLILLS